MTHLSTLISISSTAWQERLMQASSQTMLENGNPIKVRESLFRYGNE